MSTLLFILLLPLITASMIVIAVIWFAIFAVHMAIIVIAVLLAWLINIDSTRPAPRPTSTADLKLRATNCNMAFNVLQCCPPIATDSPYIFEMCREYDHKQDGN